jgi:hypothetical protein
MAFGLSAGAISLIGAGAGLVGSAMSANAAGKASEGQAQTAGDAAALQYQQYQQTRDDLAPYRQSGAQANSKLAHLLGLGSSSAGMGGGPSREQLRQQLLAQFTTTGPGGDPTQRQLAYAGSDDQQGNYGGTTGREYYYDTNDRQAYSVPQGWQAGGQQSIDENGLNAAIDAQLAAQYVPAGNDDEFGSLLKKYTGQELLSDPGYLFRRSEGQKGVERSAAGRGGLFSGQAGKELERFNQGLASTEFQAGFNRDQAYKGQTYGMLSGTSGAGQNAANMTGTAGANAAGAAGNYMTQGANASAAGLVGGANAISQGIGNFQNYNMLNSIFNKTAQGGGSSMYTPAYDPVSGYGYGNGGSGD